MKSSPPNPLSIEDGEGAQKKDRSLNNSLGVRILLVILIALFFLLNWPANPFDINYYKVAIPEGSSALTIQKILVTNNIIPRFSLFRPLVRLLGLHNQIKAGEYKLSPSDPLFRVIWNLIQGKTLPPLEAKVTFPEGTSIYKMGGILKENGFQSWHKFQGLVNEGITASLRQAYWNVFKYIPSESLEGYLFPDTYSFFLNSSVEVMAETMVNRFNMVIMPYWEANKGKTKMTLHEVLTLASIIEKEAKRPDERAKISSVFHNRLKIGMPLAADPTIKYALENPSKRVFYDQLNVKSPYNTYKNRGLPPGPICNPGVESFKAAIYPAKTDYLFFVAKKDGSHTFSKTWQEHRKAIPTR